MVVVVMVMVMVMMVMVMVMVIWSCVGWIQRVPRKSGWLQMMVADCLQYKWFGGGDDACSTRDWSNRRKFRSQTSDNMDRWKSRGGKSERRRAEERRSEKRKSEMQAREKVGKSRNTVFFQWFVAPEGRKVGSSLKRRVRSEAKSCTLLWREARFQVKMHKAHQRRSTFGSCDVEKVHAVAARSTFPSQNVQSTPRSEHFWKLRCWVVFIRDVRRSGRWFPERGCILEDQIFSFGKVILCDRRSTSYDLASLFRGKRSTSDTWTGKIAKRIGTRPSALHSTFHYWRRSRRIASFLMLPTLKIEEVSQNCCVFDVAELLKFNSKLEEVSQNFFVFDVVSSKNWGSLTE